MTVDRIGRYEVLQTLGKGAMGVVYLAQDPIIGRRLAIKTLRVDLDVEHADEFRERFIREARAAGRLNHPGIVTIHDVGEDPETGLAYIAMEYVQGHDLKQILASGHRFQPPEAARIVADVAQALDYAHAEGVVHRDIKPANIVLTADGSAKIMDFGVARLQSSNLTVEGQFIGTPNFMSPEQVAGKPVDARSDIFSMGVLLYLLLTGQRPFTGETMHEVTMKIVQAPCPIPSVAAPGLPPAFNPIVLKCVEKDPAKRFQTGGEVARVLAALARSAAPNLPPTRVGRTTAVSPDLETRLSQPTADGVADRTSVSPTTAAIKRPDNLRPKVSLRQRLAQQISLPPLFLLEINPPWAIAIIVASLLVAGGGIALLGSLRDQGPFDAPSDHGMAGIHLTARTLRAAQQHFESGRLPESEQACREVLHQVPASPAARRLMARILARVDEERSSASTVRRVENLVAEGRRLYRDGSYEDASERFNEALDLDPRSEVAASFLELSQERVAQRLAPTPSAGSGSTRSAPTPAATGALRERGRPRPTPATARITLYFECPVNAGTVRVSCGGSQVAAIPFDFSRRVLGIKRKGSGTIKKVMLIPSGRQSLEVEIMEREIGSRGSAQLERVFPGGSDWALRITMADEAADPSFSLSQSGR